MLRRATSWALLLAVLSGAAVAAEPPAATPAAPSVTAPTAATPPIDPERRALAEKLIALSGGADAAKSQMRMLYGSIAKGMGNYLPPDQAALASALQNRIGEEMAGLVPAIMDQAADVYAEVYTDQELRDIIAFRESETGKAMQRKQVEVTQLTINRMMPVIFEAMPKIMKTVMEQTCAQQHCTEKQKQLVADALEKALHRQSS